MGWDEIGRRLIFAPIAGGVTPNALQSSQMVNFYDIFSSLSLCISFGAQYTKSKPFVISSLHFLVDANVPIGHLQAASLRGQVLGSHN
jgi:hypothetical protein